MGGQVWSRCRKRASIEFPKILKSCLTLEGLAKIVGAKPKPLDKSLSSEGEKGEVDNVAPTCTVPDIWCLLILLHLVPPTGWPREDEPPATMPEEAWTLSYWTTCSLHWWRAFSCFFFPEASSVFDRLYILLLLFSVTLSCFHECFKFQSDLSYEK